MRKIKLWLNHHSACFIHIAPLTIFLNREQTAFLLVILTT